MTVVFYWVSQTCGGGCCQVRWIGLLFGHVFGLRDTLHAERKDAITKRAVFQLHTTTMDDRRFVFKWNEVCGLNLNSDVRLTLTPHRRFVVSSEDS